MMILKPVKNYSRAEGDSSLSDAADIEFDAVDCNVCLD